MTNRERRLYKSARKNKDFIGEYRQSDLENILPNLFSDDRERITIANIYYGWLVGKHGINYRNHL